MLEFSKVKCYATKLSCGDNLYNYRASSRLVFLKKNVKEPPRLSSTLFKGIKVSYLPNKFSSSQ